MMLIIFPDLGITKNIIMLMMLPTFWEDSWLMFQQQIMCISKWLISFERVKTDCII
jgi:hypothetical protein